MRRRYFVPLWLLCLSAGLTLPPTGSFSAVAVARDQSRSPGGSELPAVYQARLDALEARAAALIAAVDDFYVPQYYCSQGEKNADRLKLAKLQEDQDQLAADYRTFIRSVVDAATHGLFINGDPSNPNYWSASNREILTNTQTALDKKRAEINKAPVVPCTDEKPTTTAAPPPDSSRTSAPPPVPPPASSTPAGPPRTPPPPGGLKRPDVPGPPAIPNPPEKDRIFCTLDQLEAWVRANLRPLYLAIENALSQLREYSWALFQLDNYGDADLNKARYTEETWIADQRKALLDAFDKLLALQASLKVVNCNDRTVAHAESGPGDESKPAPAKEPARGASSGAGAVLPGGSQPPSTGGPPATTPPPATPPASTAPPVAPTPPPGQPPSTSPPAPTNPDRAPGAAVVPGPVAPPGSGSLAFGPAAGPSGPNRLQYIFGPPDGLTASDQTMKPDDLNPESGAADPKPQLIIVLIVKLTVPGWSPLSPNPFSRLTAALWNFVEPRLLARARTAGPLDSPLVAAFVSLGTATGDTFNAQFINNDERDATVSADGVVLEAVAPGGQDRVKRTMDDLVRIRGAQAPQPTVARLTGYCLDYTKPPPAAGTIYRLADSEAQLARFLLRHVLQTEERLEAQGAFTPTMNPTDYYHILRQWALWSVAQHFTADDFAREFVDHARRNSEAAHQAWNATIEAQIRSTVPRWWQDIVRIKTAAQVP